MGTPPQKSDLEGLGSLLLRAGVEPVRAEHMVREFLRAHLDEQIACQQNLRSLGETAIEALEAMRAEQHQMLKAANHTLSIFRSEAGVYQYAFSSATRLTNRLIIGVIMLQFAILGFVCFAAIQS